MQCFAENLIAKGLKLWSICAEIPVKPQSPNPHLLPSLSLLHPSLTKPPHLFEKVTTDS